MSTFWRRALLGAVVWRLLAPEVEPRFPAGQEHPLRLPGRTVFVGDREFLVREAGPVEGEPIVLVHGLGNDSLENWYELIRRLSPRYRILAVDLRNHGKSVRARERVEISRMADELAGMMDAAGIGRATVVGFSMGGMVTQELARRHPRRVEAMVLLGTSAHHPSPYGGIRRLMVLAGRALQRLTGWEPSRVVYWYMTRVGAVPARFSRWYWETSRDHDADLYYESALAVVGFDSREWIDRLHIPALVVVSIRDQLVPAAWQYDLASRLKHVEVLELADGGHEHPWTHADQIAGAIDRFMSAWEEG